ncbi:hypothetical protein J7T55_006116 [Diaporthe amygdali]|uniref:uncharacterized protein n=1 Tax=Phomopsis amygdali TaxID=1214568 RepID=UPI0022FE16C3|nr:uncharacterized protein J7T55_006116 [Diaporthe amygdali]KAJ0124775.1 hypothetical protein J7T55_006116 [Diaporthe amygdali]
MLLFLWLLLAFGDVFGITTAGYYSETCSTFVTTVSTALNIPLVVITSSTPVATVTVTGENTVSPLELANADSFSISSSEVIQSITVDAYRLETLVQCGESLSTLSATTFWTTVSESIMTSSDGSYISASATPSLSISTYPSEAPSIYSSSSEAPISFSTYNEPMRSISTYVPQPSTIESSVVESTATFSTYSEPSISTYPDYSFSLSTYITQGPITSSLSVSSTLAFSTYSEPNFSISTYASETLVSTSSAIETTITLSTYSEPSLSISTYASEVPIPSSSATESTLSFSTYSLEHFHLYHSSSNWIYSPFQYIFSAKFQRLNVLDRIPDRLFFGYLDYCHIQYLFRTEY